MNIIKLKKFFLLILFSFFIPSSALAGDLLLKSLGHGSFLIKGGKKSVLINPFKAIGCASDLNEPRAVNADFILASSKLADEGYNQNNQLMFVEPGVYKFQDILLNLFDISSLSHSSKSGRFLRTSLITF